MREFIESLPKAELHLHIEGSLEPELMFRLAKRNNISIPYSCVEDVKKAYQFSNLQSFLDIYYAGASVLITEQDFYDLTWAYIETCLTNKVLHTEIFFDPQTHTDRGIPFETVITGIHKALQDAHKKHQITSRLIMCFLRHLPQAEAQKTLQDSMPFKEWIDGVGLDSSEVGHPPSKFNDVFLEAKKLGYRIVAHAGEEAGVDYIYEALDLLEVERIDHGVQSDNSEELMALLKEKQIPLTVCPNSNIELKVFDSYANHNIKKMLDYGINVTVNSDDPAYFKGYVNQNYINIYEHLDLSRADLIKLARNSFNASFISDELKQSYLAKIDEYVLTS